MMKILKRIIFIVVLISMSIALLFVGNGYDMYKKSIEETSVEDKIAEAILDGVIKPKKKAKAVVKDDKIVIE